MNSIADMLAEAQKAAEKIDNIVKEELEEKATMCVASVQADTPVGVYPTETGKKGGTLRRNMTHSNVVRVPNGYSVTIGSSISYCQAVEEGHKQEVGKYVPAIGKRLKRAFIPGKHMIRDNVQRYQPIVEDSIKTRIEREV